MTRRIRAQTSTHPTYRIVVPIADATDAALQLRRATRTLHDQVLDALADYGLPVPQRRRIARRGKPSGRPRTGTACRMLTVVLEPETFKALKSMAITHGTTIVHVVRAALARAGYPLAAGDLLPDKRRSTARQPRRHYAMAKD